MDYSFVRTEMLSNLFTAAHQYLLYCLVHQRKCYNDVVLPKMGEYTKYSGPYN